MATLLLLALLSAAGPSPDAASPPHAGAWLTTGHAVACDIAWRELTPTARAGVAELLAVDPDFDEFGPSCDWPDRIRGIAEYDRYVTAHYVNVPPHATGVDVARDCGPGLCAIDAIEVFAGRLRDPDTSTADRLIALKYLGHVVADLHQPLHVGYESDGRGGKVSVCVPGDDSANLHWVWDSWLVEARLTATGADWRGYAEALHADISPVERRLWASRDPRDWADESFALVGDEVYDGLGEGCLTDAYALEHAFTIDRRLQQAGLRLGALLNDIFG
ncbi:MAG: S1/P1 nuclease [Gemmatimonadota bacterium]